MTSTANKEWRCIGEEAELGRKPGCRHIYAEKGKSHDLVLVFHKGKFYSLDNWCGHMGGPLHQGDIEEYKGKSCLMCPWHGYMFDLKTGENPDIPIHQAVSEVKVEGGKVYILYHCGLALEPYPETL